MRLCPIVNSFGAGYETPTQLTPSVETSNSLRSGAEELTEEREPKNAVKWSTVEEEEETDLRMDEREQGDG